MRRCPSKHRGCWLLAYGTRAYLMWCYECGAIRDSQEKRWTYPTGIGGPNPAMDPKWLERREGSKA